MIRTRRFAATWWGILAATGLLLLVALVLAGCAGPQAIVAVEPTATAFPPPPTNIPPPPPGPTPAAPDFPLSAPTHGNVNAVSDENCVACHTSEETLKAVATEEGGGQETLSEGEG